MKESAPEGASSQDVASWGRQVNGALGTPNRERQKRSFEIIACANPTEPWGLACLFAGGARIASQKSLHSELMLNHLLQLGYLFLLRLNKSE